MWKQSKVVLFYGLSWTVCAGGGVARPHPIRGVYLPILSKVRQGVFITPAALPYSLHGPCIRCARVREQRPCDIIIKRLHHLRDNVGDNGFRCKRVYVLHERV